MHKPPTLLHWDEIPPFMQDNEYIYSAYRPQSNSYLQSLASLAYIHNQTGNIYTQAIAVSVLLYVGCTLLTANSPAALAAQADQVVLGIFLISLIICCGLSFVCHTGSNHSPAGLNLMLNLDFLGILASTAGAFVPAAWYTFYCTPRKTKFVMIGLNLLAQVLIAWVTLFVPAIRTPAWRPVRAFVFGLMAMMAYVPLLVGVFMHGLQEMILLGGKFYALAAMLYLAGAALFASRWPERSRPGRFDIWGHSHQLWHLAAFAGMLVHLHGFLQACLYTTQREEC